MSSLTSQLLMGFLFVTIGFISGAAISYWLVEREHANEKPVENDINHEETVPVDQAYEEVLRIYREKVSEKLVLKVDDRMMLTRVDLNKPQLVVIERIVREAMDWIGIQLPKPAPVPPVSAARPTEIPSPIQTTPQAMPDMEYRRPASMPVIAVRPQEKKDKGETAAKSFVEQIDDILQDMLLLTPFKDRKISLEEDPRDGVIAWIENKRYVGIDAIDDPDVQKLIKIAVAKWEKSMERASKAAS